jgi:hypothetical protein
LKTVAYFKDPNDENFLFTLFMLEGSKT